MVKRLPTPCSATRPCAGTCSALPELGPRHLIEMTANWVERGGPTLDKPTRFQARDGRF